MTDVAIEMTTTSSEARVVFNDEAAAASEPPPLATPQPTTTATNIADVSSTVEPSSAAAAAAAAEAAAVTTATTRPNESADDNHHHDNDDGVDVSEIRYAAHSFHAIVIPVTITMILAATAVVYIRTPETAQAAEEALSKQYTIYRNAGQQENKGVALGQSIANGLVIVSVICVMTFVIVLFYKYRCMKCLLGYMVISSAMLLGFLASAMFQVAIDRFQLTIDKISFYVFMVNFALVGIVAIFAGTILKTPVVPAYITQGYLILTSVVVAWQLSFFDPWTAWVLLILLALYDLFAVLSPCGPLKALVKLMSREDAPEMPGLLYEANLNNNNGNNNHRHRRRTQQQVRTNNPSSSSQEQSNPHPPPDSSETSNTTATTSSSSTRQPPPSNPAAAESSLVPNPNSTTESSTTPSSSDTTTRNADRDPEPPSPSFPMTTQPTSFVPEDNDTNECMDAPMDEIQPQQEVQEIAAEEECIGYIPLALAQLYRLRLAAQGEQPQPPSSIDTTSTTSTTTHSYSAAELRALVPAVFPPNGLRIVPIDDPAHRDDNHPYVETRYSVVDRDGVQQSVLFVNYLGHPYRIIQEDSTATSSNNENNHNYNDDDDNNNNINNREDQSPTETNPSHRGSTTATATTTVEWIPFALAKMYRLRIATMGPQPAWVSTTAVSDAALPAYTPAELCTMVPVELPSGGGRIVPTITVTRQPRLYEQDVETRYTIIDRDGIHKRILFVNAEGKIFQDMREENAKIEKQERTSIKLGLGDFIFYSILVSKAALYSYTTFVASTLAIVAGLGLTLLLLAMRGQALPALPISILLGVLFYLCTRYVIQPWIQEIFIQEAYV